MTDGKKFVIRDLTLLGHVSYITLHLVTWLTLLGHVSYITLILVTWVISPGD